MARTAASSFSQISDSANARQSYAQNLDQQIWDNLKVAIAASSGFQRWQIEHPIEDKSQEVSLDCRVSRYLRETLETLAY